MLCRMLLEQRTNLANSGPFISMDCCRADGRETRQKHLLSLGRRRKQKPGLPPRRSGTHHWEGDEMASYLSAIETLIEDDSH